jgi:DNA-binding GntR family transcriptional regulator
MKEISYSVKTKVIKVEVKSIYNNLQEKMKLNQDDKIIEINRIRFINEIPFVVHYAFLPFEKCKSIMDVDLEKVSLTSSLQNILGIHLSHTEETIYAYQSELEEAKLLEIKKGSPILVVEGLTYYDNEIPIRYSIAKYRYDVVCLKTTHKK